MNGTPSPLATKLTICQQNLRKSLQAQSAFISNTSNYDMICIQEPYIDFLGNSRAPTNWKSVYPTRRTTSEDKVRAFVLIHPRLNTSGWYQLEVDSADIVALCINTEAGPLIVINIYNDQNHHDTLYTLSNFLIELGDRPEFSEGNCHLILLGDLNRHHPLWNDDKNTQLITTTYLNAAQPLLELLSDFDLHMLLPKGIPTLKSSAGTFTRPDNVFGTPTVVERLETCNAYPEHQPPIADHFPIVTTLDVSFRVNTYKEVFCWRRVDWEDFGKELEGKLKTLNLAGNSIEDRTQFDNDLEKLMSTINEVKKSKVPTSEPSPFTKRWWTKDLDKKRKEVARLERLARPFKKDSTHPFVKNHHEARNKYGESIDRAKKECWDAYLETADTATIWQVGKTIKTDPTDGGRPRIPTLQERDAGQQHTTNEEKSQCFHRSLFPPAATARDYAQEEYPEPAFSWEDLTLSQITDTLRQLKDYKACGPDGIPNEVYKHNAKILAPILLRLFRATFSLEYYPQCWKISNTVILRKPQKPDYTQPGAYRPIALLNCVSKILSSCVAQTLVHFTEKYALISDMHFLGRPGRATTDSLHLLVKTTKDAWRRKKKVSTLFLDIKAAFPSATPAVLFHNLRKRRVPNEIVTWLERKLDGRRTKICFDDYESELFTITSGIDQGCPLSVILFQFYNSDLPDIGRRFDVTVNLNIDDAMAISIGSTRTEAIEKLQEFMSAPGGAQEWSTEHNSRFALDKFALINLASRGEDLGPPLVLPNQTIAAKADHKFLGLIIDHRLRFNAHLASAIEKGTKWVVQFRRVAKVTAGISPALVKKLYLAMAIPSMLYAVDVFIDPLRGSGMGRTKGSIGAIRKLSTIHRQALLLSTGGMKTTATDVLQVHANIPPLDIIIDRICQHSIVRMSTLPDSHPLARHVKQAHRHTNVKSHRSPLHNLLQKFDINPKTMEKIPVPSLPPGWRPSFKVEIAGSKEEAAEQEKRWVARDGIRVYSDGSDYKGGVGAAAILYDPGKPRVPTAKIYLGKSTEHTVFEAEIMGIVAGLELIRKQRRVKNVSIGLDNQAAIRAISQRRSGEAQYLVDLFHEHLEAVQKKHRGLRLTIRWVPGHVGVIGNEVTDRKAKEAAQNRGVHNHTFMKKLTKFLDSSAKVRQNHHDELKTRIRERWETSPRFEKLNRLDPKLPSKDFPQLVSKLPRRHASLLFQLRSGHAPLNAHLFKIGVADTPYCPTCKQEHETIFHFIRACPTYRTQRERLQARFKGRDPPLRFLLTNAEALRPLFEYIHDTKRLQETYKELRDTKIRPKYGKGKGKAGIGG